MKYAVVETYCDNWRDTRDYNEMLRFDAPPRPTDSPMYSLAAMEDWQTRYADPAIRRAQRKYPRSTMPVAIIQVEPRHEIDYPEG